MKAHHLVLICSFFLGVSCLTSFGQQKTTRKKINPARSKRSILDQSSASLNGKVENGIYSNEYFGFSFQMPDSWFYFDKAELVPVSSQNSKTSILNTAKEKDGSWYLIGLVHYPYSKAILAVKGHRTALINESSLIDLARESQKKSMINSLYKVRSTKEVSETTIDGETAITFELAFENERDKYWQATYFLKRRNDYLEIVWATDKEEEKDYIEQILATFKIKNANSKGL